MEGPGTTLEKMEADCRKKQVLGPKMDNANPSSDVVLLQEFRNKEGDNLLGNVVGNLGQPLLLLQLVGGVLEELVLR